MYFCSFPRDELFLLCNLTQRVNGRTPVTTLKQINDKLCEIMTVIMTRTVNTHEGAEEQVEFIQTAGCHGYIMIMKSSL